MENLLLLLFGIVLCVCVVLNICGKINTIHWYNRKNIKESDSANYGKTVGAGSVIIGFSLIVAFIFLFINEAMVPLILAPATGLGLGIILYAQFRYNKGIF